MPSDSKIMIIAMEKTESRNGTDKRCEKSNCAKSAGYDVMRESSIVTGCASRRPSAYAALLTMRMASTKPPVTRRK